MSQPPQKLIQIDECLLYKCGDERWKAKKVLDVFAAPDLASQRIATLPSGIAFEPLNAAWVTTRPNVTRLRKTVSLGVDYTSNQQIASGTMIYEYANWGEGCITAWVGGYLYGYFEEGRRPSGLKSNIHLICLLVDDSYFETVAKGEACVWYKLRLSDGRYGWVRKEEVGTHWTRCGSGAVDNLEVAQCCM